MGKSDSKNMTVDIPDDAVKEALESVEKHEKPKIQKESAEPEEAEIKVEVETPPEQPAEEEIEAASEEDTGPTRAELLATCNELRQKVKDTRDRMLRIAADADNTRKRALKDRKEAQKYGQEKLFRDLLPVLDNLERTLEHVPDEADDPVVTSLREGLEMILRQFQETLAKHHLTGFSAAGEKFDPNLHEALNRTPTDEAEPGTVVAEMQRGYKLHDRLLRPALVSVACRPDESQEAPAAEDGEE
jgi:molecular chaperone GrpE